MARLFWETSPLEERRVERYVLIPYPRDVTFAFQGLLMTYFSSGIQCVLDRPPSVQIICCISRGYPCLQGLM